MRVSENQETVRPDVVRPDLMATVPQLGPRRGQGPPAIHHRWGRLDRPGWRWCHLLLKPL